MSSKFQNKRPNDLHMQPITVIIFRRHSYYDNANETGCQITMARSFKFLTRDNYERNYFLIPEVQCGDPGDPVNATVVRRSGSFKFGHSIMYECNTDHVPCRVTSSVIATDSGVMYPCRAVMRLIFVGGGGRGKSLKNVLSVVKVI